MYAAEDSFCSLEDVQALCQRGVFSDNTRPTQDDVLQFCALRSAKAQSVMAEEGLAYTVPSGAFPLTESADPTLYRLCVAFAAIAAAGDVAAARSAPESADLPTRATERWADAKDHLALIRDRARRLAAKGSAPTSAAVGSGPLPSVPETW